MYTSDKRLWLTEDRSTVVEDGDPAARYLLVGEGGELPDALAAQYHLKPSKAAKATDAVAPAEGKAVAEPPQTKAVKAPEGKK